ncbi:MAG: glutamate synthase-related protein [Planctomycetota bacterium]
MKKACVYDRHRQETEYIRNLSDVNALFFDCMGCFSCVQNCTKGLLGLVVNPAYERLGNSYWTPEIIQTTWMQAETAKIPVSGAGYRGPFSGPGFDSMWTDMSEIVRPTRDGIHGREYISTAVDIGRKPSFLTFECERLAGKHPPLVSIPMPLIIDMDSPQHTLPALGPILRETARRTGLIAIVNQHDGSFTRDDREPDLSHVAFHLDPKAPPLPKEVLDKTKLVEMPDSLDVLERIRKLKTTYPDIVISVRIALDSNGCKRAIELADFQEVEVIHVAADLNGNEIGAQNPRFIKDMIREIHTSLVENGRRDEITLIAGGGIALAEHMAKVIICGADLVTINLPLLIALECQLCDRCRPGMLCPAKLERIDFEYGVGRMTNLIAAWHDQLIEVMGAMGMREARRLRGDVGRAMFFEQLEEETFGKLFGTRK